MKKNNVFDTEIQMVDLESMDNMEISFDESSEPNPMLADEVRLNMKETQVISAEEIEKVMKENTAEDMPASGETIVIPSRVIKKIVDVPENDGGYSHTSNESHKTGFENDEFGETVTFDTQVINAAYEEKKNSNMLEPDESYDFEDDLDEPVRKKVHHVKEKSEKELRAEEERQLRKEARAEARAEEKEARAEARAEEKMARAEARAEAAAEAKEAKLAAKAEAKELKAEAAAEAREAKLAARAEEKELKAEAAAEAREVRMAAKAEAKQGNPAAKQAIPQAKRGNPAAKQGNPQAKQANGQAKPAVKNGANPAAKTGAKPVAKTGTAPAAKQGNPAAKPAVAKPAGTKPAAAPANKPVQHAKSAPAAPKTEFHTKGEQRPRVPEMPVKVFPPQEKKPAAPAHIAPAQVMPDMGMTQDIPVENMNTEAIDTAFVNENIQENIHNVQNVSREKVVHKKSKKKSRSAIGVVEIAGVAIALLLVILLGVLGVKLIEKNKQKNNVAQFASIGALYSEMDSIGNEGILAIGEKASISSVTVPEEIESTDENPEETGADQNVSPVSVNFLSIEKDLKIKFLDKNTGKLISGIQFEVTAKGPKGDDFKWTDSDMDGMIYVDKLQPGNYEVKVLSVPPYTFPDTATTVKVQDTIVYQVINVIDEAQDMSQVDLAKEENNGKEVEEGNKLQDTVEFV